MGAVYSAHHLGIDRHVAVKILQPNVALGDDRVLGLFEREAKLTGRLLHENIAIVMDAGRTPDGIAYIVMEWLEGRTLEEELSAHGPLSFSRTADILRQVAAALDAAHARQIIHRDLKPSNVMLTQRPDGREQVKVLDFGIGKVISETTASPVSAVMGTPHYASPEQLRLGGRIDGRADLYSLGVMLYQMLTGALPFDATSVQGLIQQQLTALPPPIRKLRPEAPAAVEQLVSRMLAKDPEQRPARASDLLGLIAHAFKAAAESEVGSAQPAIKGESQPRPAEEEAVEERSAALLDQALSAARAEPTLIDHPPPAESEGHAPALAAAPQWQQIDQLLEAALELTPAERAAFLDQACAADEVLRREVESLLAAHEQAGSFIETPPDELAAAMLADGQAGAMVGRTLGHYRLRSLLGAGGMGEVYLAEDTRLGRKVALKLLPKEFTQDRERVRRFQQEARAASALSHPNILTIFEIGQIDDLHFIAAEFIDGQTLRQRMMSAPLRLREVLEVAVQVASALSAAHEAGIVHRDIKPENVMLRRDGYVKVLDFGLAKLIEPIRADAATIAGSELSARAQVSTDPGKAVGTPRYMSPEQIRAQEVDGRSDIFSLGVLLYELVAGRAPFEGATPLEVIAAILNTEAPPLERYSREVPAELERIVTKALQKDCEERYQTAKDLLIDLRDLKLELELEAKLARALKPEAHDVTRAELSAGQGRETSRQQATRSGEGVAAHTTSSAEYWLGVIERHQRGALLALAALVVISAGLAFVWSQWTGERRQAVPFRMDKITRLTTTGKAMRVAISPDGKEIIYSIDDAGQQSLWLRQVDPGSEIQIVPPDSVEYRGITFSSSGNFVYYVRREQNDSIGVLYRATKLGGATRRLLSHVDSPITLSPDGKQLAFVRQGLRSGESALMVANEDGAGAKELAMHKRPHMFRPNGPAWSPDGRLIACGSGNNVGSQSVVGVRVADGREEPLTSQKWGTVGQVAWLPDGRGLIMAAAEPQGYWTQIWRLSYPGGEAHRITAEDDLNNYFNLSLTDSGLLATVRGNSPLNIWLAPNADASRARQITTGVGTEDGLRGLAWTPDGKIVYRSTASGNPQVWIMAADGTGKKQLSVNTHHNFDPTVSPDGRYVVWSASRTDIRHIWRMELDGGNPTPLTSGDGEWFPQCSPDGKWLVYQAFGFGPDDGSLWKMPMDGGASVQLTNKPSYAPVISPDGKLIACNYRNEADAPIRMAVIPFEGGPPLKTFDLRGTYDRPIRWTPDGRALAYIVTRDGVSNIWSQPLTGGGPKPLTDFKTQRISNFAWSRDGKQLALARGVTNSDVVLITGFR
jgi:serine/threonine protein kinase/Tol biopolymer transport system component